MTMTAREVCDVVKAWEDDKPLQFNSAERDEKWVGAPSDLSLRTILSDIAENKYVYRIKSEECKVCEACSCYFPYDMHDFLRSKGKLLCESCHKKLDTTPITKCFRCDKVINANYPAFFRGHRVCMNCLIVCMEENGISQSDLCYEIKRYNEVKK